MGPFAIAVRLSLSLFCLHHGNEKTHGLGVLFSPFGHPLVTISTAHDRCFDCTMDLRRLIPSLWYRYRIPFAMAPPSLLLFALHIIVVLLATWT